MDRTSFGTEVRSYEALIALAIGGFRALHPPTPRDCNSPSLTSPSRSFIALSRNLSVGQERLIRRAPRESPLDSGESWSGSRTTPKLRSRCRLVRQLMHDQAHPVSDKRSGGQSTGTAQEP